MQGININKNVKICFYINLNKYGKRVKIIKGMRQSQVWFFPSLARSVIE
jgi:hypothetical protein